MIEPYYYDGAVTLYHGNALELMAEPAFPFAGVVMTDPPYGTGGWRRHTIGNHAGKLVQEKWDDGCLRWFDAFSFLKIPTITFWPSCFTWRLLKRAARAKYRKHRCLFMRKLDPKPQVNNRIAWSVEPIWVLSRPGFVLYGGTDSIDVSMPKYGRNKDASQHPYEKPLKVMNWLCRKLPPEIKTVLDPFAGTGTTLLAAKLCGLKAIGIEQDERWCEWTANRCRQGTFNFTETNV